MHVLRALPLIALAGPGLALDLTQMSEADKTAFDKAVRDVLITQPDIVAQALDAAQPSPMEDARKQDEERLSNAQTALNGIEGDLIIGPEGGNLITLFAGVNDATLRMAQVLTDLQSNAPDNTRLVIKHLPDMPALARIQAARGTPVYLAQLKRWIRSRPGYPDPNSPNTQLARELQIDRFPMTIVNGIMIRGDVPAIAIEKHLSP